MDSREPISRWLDFVIIGETWEVISRTPCWKWTGALSPGGYGKFTSNSVTTGAHRWGYEYFRGPIPEGFHVDHLCRVRCCVNSNHLESVTAVENIRRSKVHTHCRQGHPFNDENTYFQKNTGNRLCRACHRRRMRERYQRLRTQGWTRDEIQHGRTGVA